MEWLLAPIDPDRIHDVGVAVSWHGRLMTVAWGIMAPLAIIIARYFKITPRQNWPDELDNRFWWKTHWMTQTAVAVLTFGAFGLIWQISEGGHWHGRLGYCVLLCLVVQVVFGILRGSKGGPENGESDPAKWRGDHYDMTLRRVVFEYVHKWVGYLTVLLAFSNIATGMWMANGPVWMWLVIGGWWCALLGATIILQRRQMAIDTYQAIWGPDPVHPGNRRKPIGWGIVQLDGDSNVRND